MVVLRVRVTARVTVIHGNFMTQQYELLLQCRSLSFHAQLLNLDAGYTLSPDSVDPQTASPETTTC